jgi:hypothetical protein
VSTPPDTAGRDPPRERVVLTLEAMPSDRPFATRLKLVLKDLLRRQQLKCIDVSWPKADRPPDAEEKEEPDR